MCDLTGNNQMKRWNTRGKLNVNDNQTIPTINFRLHLILFFITGSLWIPFYNLICFIKMNTLAKMAKQKGVKLEQNITIGLFILAATVVGAPIVFYRRFQLLQNHLTNLE